MSWLSKAFEKAAPVIATFSPEPISRSAAQAKVIYDQVEAGRVQKQRIQDVEAERKRNMEETEAREPNLSK